MLNIETKFAGDFSAQLEKFEQDIQEKVAFSGVAAMAKVMYEEAKERCPVSEGAHFFYGTSYKKSGQRYFFQSGNLKAAIYRVYSPEKSSDTVKTYRISWNHSKAPYGFMVEFGTSRAPAHPFMRPAFSRINDAIDAGTARMAEKFDEIKGQS